MSWHPLIEWGSWWHSSPWSAVTVASERPLNGLAVITALTDRPLHNGNGRLEILHIGLDRYNGRGHYIGNLMAIDEVTVLALVLPTHVFDEDRHCVRGHHSHLGRGRQTYEQAPRQN